MGAACEPPAGAPDCLPHRAALSWWQGLESSWKWPQVPEPQLRAGGGPLTLWGVITTPHPGSLIKVAQMAQELVNDTGTRSWPGVGKGGRAAGGGGYCHPVLLP